MGQEQSSTMSSSQGPQKSCTPCGDWGKKDHGTVKVDGAALHALGKENSAQNAAHPNILNGGGGKTHAKSREEEEAQQKARHRQEMEAKQEELRRQEEQRREMERRIQEEQERQQAELRRREAEKILSRQLQLEQQAREAEELERQRREQERQQQEQERQLEEQRREEENRKIAEMEGQKKVQAWLKANGFKGVNDLVRKKFSKVTPLQVVIQQNDVEMLKLLLENGADAAKVNGKNESAVTVAQKIDKKGSHGAVVQALMTHQK